MENLGLAVQFFKPLKRREKIPGRLYILENGTSYIEFEGPFIEWLQPNHIIYAVGPGNEKYSLINCILTNSSGEVLRVSIKELYKGDHIKEARLKKYKETEIRLTGLTNWIDHPRIKPKIIFNSQDESNVILKRPFRNKYHLAEGITLTICEFCGERYSRNETILNNLSYIRLCSDKLLSRQQLYHYASAFSKFLSLFTFQIPKMTGLDFSDARGRTIEVLTAKRIINDDNDALLKYTDLQDYLETSLNIFYQNREKFVSVINLLNQSKTNHTPEVSFLNITSAFEVFHTAFLENNNKDLRERLYMELKEKGLVNRNTNKWDQVLRYLHLFEIVNNFAFYRVDVVDLFDTLETLRNSRNYYTHFSPTEKKYWSRDELFIVNRTLRLVLHAVLLLQLNIPFSLINKRLNNRGSYMDEKIESNPYSLLYKK